MSTRRSRRRPLKPRQPTGALVTYSARVQLERVLDLTQESVRKQLDATLAELAEPWRFRKDGKRPPTQRLGAEAAASARVQAIRYCSTKGPGDCFVRGLQS